MASNNASTRSANVEAGTGANARLSAAVSAYGAGMQPTVLPEQWSLVEQWHMERREPVELWRSSVSNQLSNLKNRLSKSLHDFPRRVTGPKRYEKPSEDTDRSSEPFGDNRGASGEVGEPSATSEDFRRLSDKKPT
ncbi:Hypp3911 [Branchiostoma lanceolatum]|uniref:Hypp3911 protein n=1 Tax=Branchiostoma lanceolatum TaxID=7740 RepID=A0A8K0A494_BRALA|nr:Hypp3911 [Branchiostoma lanceolatum]